jgi:pimeloyl-ACP methyl ester carboxylesterase
MPSMRTLLLLMLLAGSAIAAPGRTDEVAAHYRRLEGLAENAKASPATQRLIEERGSATGLDKRWEDGVAAAELHLLGNGEDRAFLAARAAWRFLARSNGGQKAQEAERRRANRIYNLACSACASVADWSGTEWQVAGTRVRLERTGFLAEPIRDVVPACLQDVREYGERAEADGIGGAVFVMMPRTKKREAAWPYLPPVDFPYPASALLRFDGEQLRFVLHDPLAREAVELFGRAVPLRADFTAPIAAMVAQVDLDEVAEKGMRTPKLDLEALYLLEPPRDDKIPVLFVHGLQSSPAAYRQLANALRADPKIRRHFQFVAYQYPTGYPLALLNTRLRKVMRTFWTWFDERAPRAREHGYIGIGHSMGGLQIKALAVSSGLRIWDLLFTQGPAEIDLTGREGDLLRRLALFEPDPKLARIVFLAVPHRGSPWATGIVGAVGRRRVSEDPIVRDLRETILRRYGEQLREELRRRISEPRTSIDDLDPSAPYLCALAELPLRKGLPYHSIIGDLAGKPEAPAGDGVVPYKSSHLDGAASELIVQSGHSVQRTPQAIAEVKRILLLHLAEAKNR